MGPYEIRINHRHLLELLLSTLGIPKDRATSAMGLLATAAAASPAAAAGAAWVGLAGGGGGGGGGAGGGASTEPGGDRYKLWPAIKAGLLGLGLSADTVAK